MNVSSIGSTQTAYAAGGATGFAQSAADFKSLAQSLQSGDLAGAQQAFATLQQDSPRVARAISSLTAGSSATGAAASPLQALSTALKAGDLAGAQQAFAAMQQAHGGHHGHHHHAPSTTPVSVTPPGTTTGGDVGSSNI